MSDTRLIHPALDYTADTAYVGIYDERKCYQLIQANQSGLARLDLASTPALFGSHASPCLTPPHSLVNRWDRTDRDRFLGGDPAPGLATVLGRVRGELTSHVDFTQPREASVVALWIVGTYFHPLFLAYPRLNLFGEKGSGKSKVLRLAERMAFNGLWEVSPTQAVLFRLAQDLRPTLCLDEMENLLDTREKAGILQVINAGYLLGGSVARTEEIDGRRQVVHYDVYAPMALASITGLNDVTADRAITLVMEPGQEGAKLNRRVDPASVAFTEIRAGLYRLALTRYGDVRTVGDAGPDWLVARQRELFSPLLGLAELAKAEGDDSFLADTLNVAQRERAERGALSHEGRALFEVLGQWLTVQPSVAVKPGQLADALRDRLTDPRFSAERAGALLKRYGFTRRRDKGGSVYVVTREDFEGQALRYKLEPPAFDRPAPIARVA